MSSLRSSLLKPHSNSMTRATSTINLNNSCYGSSFSTGHLSSMHSSSSVHSAIHNSTSTQHLPNAPSISSGIGSIVNNSSSSNVLSSSEVSDCGSSGLIAGVSPPPPSGVPSITTTTSNNLNTLTIYSNNNDSVNNTSSTSSSTNHKINGKQTPHLAFKNMFSFQNSISTRHSADSVTNSLNTNVDIENPQVWNNHPLVISADDSLAYQNKNLFHRYSLRLPNKLENEFLDHHFNSQIFLLRITNLIGILCVSYGFTKNAIFMLIAVRVLCLNLFAFSIFLSFLKNKNFYKQSYHPLFLFSFTTFFITILLEYKSTTTTYILFLYSVTFCCLYSLGCLLFVWMVVLNLMHASCFIIFLLIQPKLDRINMISYTLYILSIFIMGSSHLYVLEKSRKESFVDSKRLQKKAESLKVEKEKSEQLLSNILPEFVIKMMKDYTPTANSDILNNYLTQSNSPLPPISKDFPECSILYCDIVDFTSLASKVEPEQLVKLLNEVFTEFDKVVESHHCEKIKTDGDAYVCAGGLTIENKSHYKAIVDIAIDILRLSILNNNCLNVKVKLRVGVATGSVIGGVIGCEKFQFDVWGEAIAMAHTLEQNGSSGQIHITERGLDKLNLEDYILVENTDCNLGVTTYFISSSRYSQDLKATPSANGQSNIPTILCGQDESYPKDGSTTPFDEKPIHLSIDTASCSGSSSSMSLPSSTPTTPRSSTNNGANKKKVRRTHEKLGDIIMKPIRQGIFFKKDEESEVGGGGSSSSANNSANNQNGSESKQSPLGADENTEVDKYFREYTKLNRWIVQFRNLFVEMEYHKYVINSTVFETKFFLAIGILLHIVFYLDDYLMGSNPVFGARNIYLAMGLTFVLYFITSFTRFFKHVYIYQVAFFLLLLMFGISTTLELLRYDNPLARSSLTRVCATLFYANVFHSLNFISVTFLNIFIFSFFFICALFLSPSLTKHLYATDYMGIIIVLIIQVCSSYGMKLGMRRAWVIKSKVKYKGLILQKERERSSKLLGNILPTSISERLMKEGKGKGNGMLIAQKYSHVAIMFINIIGFEKLPVQLEASVMVSHMNYIFSIFDGQLARYDLDKIKTIGTTYMVVSGLNTSQSPRLFLSNVANMALTAKAYVKHIDENLNVQIGISFGPCVAGCIGIQRAKFDVWGDTANIASRMQTSAPPGKIQVTKEVSKVLKRGFFLEERGVIKVKGKGEMTSFYLTGKKGSTDCFSSDSNALDQLPSHWKLLQTNNSSTTNNNSNTTMNSNNHVINQHHHSNTNNIINTIAPLPIKEINI